ncbi:MAG TPA: hypothetical protein VF266_17055 [Thermoanaerobaculia bacterium]
MLLIAVPAGAQQRLAVNPAVDHELTQIGASEIEWSATGNRARVSVTKGEELVAELGYKWETGSLELTWEPVERESFIIRWSGPRFSLTLEDGRAFVQTFNPVSGKLESDRGFDEQVKLRFEDIAAVADLMGKIDRATGRGVVRMPKPAMPLRENMESNVNVDCTAPLINCVNNPGTEIVLDPGTNGPLPTIQCQGPLVWGEAYSLLSRRSVICGEARNDANIKCSGALCIGCCELRECNAYCQLGDFYCWMAAVEGRMCSRG